MSKNAKNQVHHPEIHITPFKLLGEVEVQERLLEFVAHYQRQATLLPMVSSFEENIWDLKGKYFAPIHGNKKLSIRFVRLDQEDQAHANVPFSRPFLDFAKAYVLHLIGTKDWSSTGSLASQWLPVLRYVEQGLRSARPSEPPCITTLTADVCETVNAAIRQSSLTLHGRYSRCRTLNQLVESLQDLGLCTQRFTWEGTAKWPQIPRHFVGPEGDQAREAMLPTLAAMGATAYCFEHAEGAREQWISAINAMLAGQPARVSECWFLRENWCVEDDIQGQKRFGLRWWPAKKAQPLVKWFLADDPFVPVWRQAIAWLTEISAPARAMARWYEENPGKLFLPPEMEHLREKEILTVAEASSLRGGDKETLLRKVAGNWAHNKGIKTVTDPVTGKQGIRFTDMEKAILSDLPYGFPWYQGGRKIKYSQMLLLFREAEFKPTQGTSPTMFAVPNSTTYYILLDAMVDRHGCVEGDGTPVRIRSHQFRHKQETVAYAAGVERAWANHHAGRQRTSQEESYDDRTDAQRVAQSSVVSVRQSVFGDLRLLKPNRPRTEAEQQVELKALKRTGYRHVTPFGGCNHTWLDKPCMEFMDCLFCEDHICRKGVSEWEANIRAACAENEENLAHGLEAARRGLYGAKEHVQDLLLPRAKVCRQHLAVLDDPNVPLLTQWQLAPKADPYNPLVNTMRHYIELGRKEGRDKDVAWIEKSLAELQSIRSRIAERSLHAGGEAE